MQSGHIYVVVSREEVAEGCGELTLRFGDKELRTAFQEQDGQMFAPIDLSTLEKAAASSGARVGICGSGGDISPTNLAGLRRLIRQFHNLLAAQ